MTTRKAQGMCKFCRHIIHGVVVTDDYGKVIRTIPRYCDSVCVIACGSRLAERIEGELAK